LHMLHVGVLALADDVDGLMDEHRSGHDMILPRPDARTPTAGSR
jgi:hypothetical protein